MNSLRLFVLLILLNSFAYAIDSAVIPDLQQEVVQPNAREFEILKKILLQTKCSTEPLKFSATSRTYFKGTHSVAHCGSEGRMTKLDLSKLDMSGVIPEEIFELEHLTHLDLSGNSLDGPLCESIQNLSKLKELDLSSNKLSGVFPRVDHLQDLEILYLQYNYFAGPFPKSLGSLSKLISFDLT